MNCTNHGLMHSNTNPCPSCRGLKYALRFEVIAFAKDKKTVAKLDDLLGDEASEIAKNAGAEVFAVISEIRPLHTAKKPATKRAKKK